MRPLYKKLVENAVFEENGAKDMHNATGKVNVADGPSGRDANLCGIGFWVLDSSKRNRKTCAML